MKRFQPGSAKPQRLVLVGFMGSGKSTLAQHLGRIWGAPVWDTDEQITARAGKNIPQLFAEDGEPAFRDLEHQVLLETPPGAVVALGGGGFAFARNRDWIRSNGTSVWLDLPLEILEQRLKGASDRPLWGKSARERRLLFSRRCVVYGLADHRLKVESRGLEAVADLLDPLRPVEASSDFD